MKINNIIRSYQHQPRSEIIKLYFNFIQTYYISFYFESDMDL